MPTTKNKKVVAKKEAVKKVFKKKSTAVKKSPVKKATTVKVVAKKKSAPKKATKSVVHVKARSTCAPCLFEASADKAFWVNNGPIVSTLEGLREALEGMSDEQFEYHTKRAGNDFAIWVDEVLCHGKCAKKLSSATSRHHAVRAIATCSC